MTTYLNFKYGAGILNPAIKSTLEEQTAGVSISGGFSSYSISAGIMLHPFWD
jgi:hypothetical protein